jgi:cyclophilin family peptidyl-prolyl cis-trans isomerase
MPGIFISYRRDDAAGWAGRLSADLRAGLRGAPVFMDIDAIPPGVPYDDYIAQAVGSCDVLIALIGPHWLTVTDKAGRRRLDDPADLTRLEILAALKRNIRVIPALVGGAEMPATDELPDALKPLGRRQAYELADHRWNEDCARLVQVLKPIVHAGGSTGRRLVVGAGLLLALLATGAGVKLWLDTPTTTATPTTTTITTPTTTTLPTTTTTTLPTTTTTTLPTTTTVPTTTTTTTPPSARVEVSPTDLTFGSREVRSVAEPDSLQRVVIRNLTAAPVEVKYSVSGPNARDFPLRSSGCGHMVLTTRGCSIVFSFVPTEVGKRSAVLVIDVLGSEREYYKVGLEGIGTEGKNTSTARLITLDIWQGKTGLGGIVIALDADRAPATVANFLQYVGSGFYNGTVFHRAAQGRLIEGGWLGMDLKERKTGPPIRNEAKGGLSNRRGTIAMVWRSVPDGATTRFLINVRDNPAFDFGPKGGLAVFGRVVKGMDLVDKIAGMKTAGKGDLAEMPEPAVLIRSAKEMSPRPRRCRRTTRRRRDRRPSRPWGPARARRPHARPSARPTERRT